MTTAYARRSPKGQQELRPVGQNLQTAFTPIVSSVCGKAAGYKRERWDEEKHSFLACQTRKMFRLAVLVRPKNSNTIPTNNFSINNAAYL